MAGKKVFAASLVFGLMILAAMLYFSDTGKIASMLMGISLPWISLTVLVYTIGWLIRGRRWQAILGKIGCRAGFKDTLMLTVVGNFANLIMPAKLGELVRVYGSKKLLRLPYKAGLVSVGIDRFFDMTGVLFLACLSFLAVFTMFAVPAWITLTMAAASVLLLAGFVVLSFSGRMKMLFKGRQRISQVLDFMEKALDKRMIFMVFFLSVCLWITESLIAYIVMTSLGIAASLMVVIFAIMVGNLTKTFPLTPGNLGIYEVAVTSVLVLAGLPYEVALSVAIIDHLIKNAYTLVAGSFSTSRVGFDIMSVKGQAG